MRRIIYKVASNPPLLLLSSQDLVETLEPLTGTEPKLVRTFVRKSSGLEVKRSTNQEPLDLRSSGLTNIAFTLHRQTAYGKVA